MENYIATMMTGALSVLLLALGAPLALEKVPPNRWYGYRVSKYVFQDEEIWYAVNRSGGLQMLLAGCGFAVLTGISVFFLGHPGIQAGFAIGTALLAIGWVLITSFFTVRQCYRMAAEKGLWDSGDRDKEYESCLEDSEEKYEEEHDGGEESTDPDDDEQSGDG